MTLKVIAIILIFTVVCETLLDKFWRYKKRGTHLAEFGNLYIVLGCLISSFIILSVDVGG